MLPTQKAQLRSALLSLKIQPTLLPPCGNISTSTPLKRSLKTSSNRPFARPPARPSSAFEPIRYRSASTTATPPAVGHAPPSPAPANTSASPATTTINATSAFPQSSPSTASATISPYPSLSDDAPTSQPLTWNTYLALRKTRRRYNLFASLSTSMCTTAVGVSVLSQQNLDTVSVFGLDPFIVLGVATLGSGAVGWLLGPFVGNAVFGMRYRRIAGQIAEKEKDLYRRIKKHRVDPSSQSYSNPVPDYYGEKIGSVREYRNWMKDQRAYNKKRQSFL